MPLNNTLKSDKNAKFFKKWEKTWQRPCIGHLTFEPRAVTVREVHRKPYDGPSSH